MGNSLTHSTFGVLTCVGVLRDCQPRQTKNTRTYNVDEARAQTVRALVVSDVRLYREGLAQMLCEAPGVLVVGSAAGAPDALEQVREASPDVVLLDMTMSDALALARQIARESKITKVVALGMPELETDVLSGAAAGIAG